jgi:hypothetical protein
VKLTTARPEYLPELEYFWNIAQSDILILTDHFQYIKRSPITVSPPLSGFGSSLRIPVRHSQTALSIKDKSIDNRQTWREKHLKSLHHQFHLTPFGYYYLPRFEEIYMESGDNLSDFLIALLENFTRFLHLPITVKRASQLPSSKNNTQTVIDWCRMNGSDEYLTNREVLAKGWIAEEALNESHIRVSSFIPLPHYHILQSYRGFSAIGFLMQYGPEAGYILKQYLPQK